MNSFYTINATSEAWLLLAYFMAMFVMGFLWRSWVVYSKSGINPLVLARDDTAHGYIGRSFKIVMALLFAYLVVHAFGYLSGMALLWSIPAWLNLTIWIFLWIAFVWMLIAQWQMGLSWRVGIDAHNSTSLVMHGLFRYGRNPIFLSLRVAIFCLLILLPTAPVFGLATACELLMQIQVRLEEAYLERMHGLTYTAYCRRVRRWV